MSDVTRKSASAARRIAHLDMDAFFVSVELLRRPELRGLAVVVGGRRALGGDADVGRLGDYRGRGVVTTATYEARAHGVRSGMGLMQAARLAPQAVLLAADFDAYRHYSRLFKAAAATVAPRIEDRGIDEIYIDLDGLPGPVEALARRIKQAVAEATGLSCSICVAPNKLLAKIGSELDKPDGLTLLDETDFRARVWPLPVGRINGIGPKAAARLAGLGIATIGELAAADSAFLQSHFGRASGLWLHEAAQGIDERPVVTHAEPKSLSRETTFERDLHPRRDRQLLSEIFSGLCRRLAQDLQQGGYAGRTVGIKLRYEDFRTVTRDNTLAAAVFEAAAIRRAAGECLRRVPLDRKLRLLGVRVGALQQADAAVPAPSPQQELPLADARGAA
ncbi:MAG TPA: DNA polymerase IV [Candidatus Desulfobacillus sp.]|nr:DNA polymerase IV [Candidatus Desulfobacillus sp.]